MKRFGTRSASRKRTRGRVVDLVTADELAPNPQEHVLRTGAPDTIEGWKALAEGLLANQSCVFHRNLEISSRYAWIYKHQPACFKWAGMAAGSLLGRHAYEDAASFAADMSRIHALKSDRGTLVG